MAKNSDKQWSGKSRGGRFGYQFFVYTIRLLGVRCAYCFLAFIVIYFIPFAPKATRAIWRYNRQQRGLGVFASIKELYCHYYLFGQTLIDKIAMRGGLAERYRYEFDNYTRFLEILNSGQGVVMIGAHIGCWEAGAGFFGTYGKKINIVMLDAEHQQIKDVLEENANEQNNYNIIALNQNIIDAMLQMKVALNNGEYICFNGDRYIGADNTAEIEFMGSKALFPRGLFQIAAKCRVPVVFYYSMREPNCTYRFIFEEPQLERKITPESLLEQYAKSLERIVAKYPRQWFNFYDFWNIKNN
ncbi:MAG: acyltransferase [Alistipes sp.]|jgi:predicted LPLAT superfamily acyltransferase|nr:acyltransferase [Alistipes sp.]